MRWGADRVTRGGRIRPTFCWPLGARSQLALCASVVILTAVIAGGGAQVTAGASWRSEPTLNPAPPPGRVDFHVLDGVSCISANACWASGVSGFIRTTGATLVEFWNGGSWAVQPSPNPTAKKEKYAVLTDLSCSSPKACIAVGNRSEER